MKETENDTLQAENLLPPTLDFLRNLVEINSHSLNRDGVEKNADLIATRFADFGWAQHRIPSSLEGAGQHLILDSGHSGPVVFLISHLDTVFTAQEQAAAGSAWNLEGRRVRGPGTIDNKGGTAVRLKDSGSASAKTGMQRQARTGPIPPGSVIGGQITSVPGSKFKAAMAVWTAAVPELTAVAKLVPTWAANSFS
jgi:hypothetical protein